MPTNCYTNSLLDFIRAHVDEHSIFLNGEIKSWIKSPPKQEEAINPDGTLLEEKNNDSSDL